MPDVVDFVGRVYQLGVGNLGIWYYATSAKTVTLDLLDVNGNAVIPQGSVDVQEGINDISASVDNWIGQNESSLIEGIYLLKVGDYITPIFVAQDYLRNTFDPTPVSIRVVDMATGLMVSLPPHTSTLPANTSSLRWLVLAYQYDSKTGKGRILTPPDDSVTGGMDTGWAGDAVLRFELGFNSLDDLIEFLMRVTAINDYDAFKFISWVYNNDPEDAVALLKPYGYASLLGGRVLYLDVDVDNHKIVWEEHVELGFFDWGKLKEVLAVGASVGAVVVAGFAGGPPAAAAVGVVIASMWIYAKLRDILSSTSPGATKAGINAMKNQIDQTKNKLSGEFDEVQGKLNEFLKQGQISEDAYNYLTSKLRDIRYKVMKALDDTKSMLDRAYKVGYSDGRKSGLVMGGLGGVAGTLIAEKIFSRRGAGP